MKKNLTKFGGTEMKGSSSINDAKIQTLTNYAKLIKFLE